MSSTFNSLCPAPVLKKRKEHNSVIDGHTATDKLEIAVQYQEKNNEAPGEKPRKEASWNQETEWKNPASPRNIMRCKSLLVPFQFYIVSLLQHS